MTVVIITGTGTGVGKTIATAALASCARDIAVCKPVQTGDDDDLAEIARLSGVHEFVSVARYPVRWRRSPPPRRSGDRYRRLIRLSTPCARSTGLAG